MTAWNKAVRYAAYLVELLLLFALQETPQVIPPILSVRPILILGLAVTVSLLESDLAALGFGVLTGLLMDYAAGGALGVCGILVGVVCCVLSAVAEKKLNVTLSTAVVSGILCLGLLFVLLWAVRFVLPGYSHILVALVDRYLPMFLYTVLTMPLIYIINLGIYHALRDPEGF